MANRVYDNYDEDVMFTYGQNGAVLYVDDPVLVTVNGEKHDADILEIAHDGCRLKVLLNTGEVLDVQLSHVEEAL